MMRFINYSIMIFQQYNGVAPNRVYPDLSGVGVEVLVRLHLAFLDKFYLHCIKANVSRFAKLNAKHL